MKLRPANSSPPQVDRALHHQIRHGPPVPVFNTQLHITGYLDLPPHRPRFWVLPARIGNPAAVTVADLAEATELHTARSIYVITRDIDLDRYLPG